MGKVSFPLHNVRKDVLNKWHLAELSEELTVPSQADSESGFYTVSLTEIPDSSSDHPVSISGLTEYRGNPYDEKQKKLTIGANQFYVNYTTGTILFNSAQSGTTHTVTYWGKGSLVEADDVNDLDDRVVGMTSTVATLEESVAQAQQAVTGMVADVNDVKLQTATLTGDVVTINSDLQSVHTSLDAKADQTSVDSAIADVTALVQSYAEDGGVIDTKVAAATADFVTNSAYESDQSAKEEVYDAKYATISSVETVTESVSGVSGRVETLENAGYITSSALEPLATKQEIADMATKTELQDYATQAYVGEQIAAIDIPDVSEFATESFVTEKIAEIDIPDVSNFATTEYVGEQIAAIDIPDVSNFVTAEDVSTAISGAGHVSASQLSGLVAINGDYVRPAEHKIITKSNNKDLTAMIWNEESGGGAMFINEDVGTKSFIGVNNGVDVTPNFWVQGYAINTTSKLGSRIELDTTGFYYTKNQTNYSYTADDEVVVKKDIAGYATQEYVGEQIAAIDIPDVSSFVTAEDVSAAVSGAGHASQSDLTSVDTKVDSTHDAFLERIVNLEMKIADLSRTNIDTVPSTAQITYSDTTKDVVISADAAVTAPANITAKSVEVSGVSIESADANNAAKLNVTTDGKVTLTDTAISGAYKTNTGTGAQVNVHTEDYVEIRDCTFNADGYNTIEIGYPTGVAKGVIVDNCNFVGKFTNNAILVFAHKDDAVIKISNCTFEDVSNALRISNRTNTKGTFILENCTFNKWDSNLAYGGAVICEDYSSKSVAAETENNLFAPEKIKIKFINCTGPDGNVMVGGPDPSAYCGSNDENQIMYVYNDYGGALAYDPARYPEVTFG